MAAVTNNTAYAPSSVSPDSMTSPYTASPTGDTNTSSIIQQMGQMSQQNQMLALAQASYNQQNQAVQSFTNFQNMVSEAGATNSKSLKDSASKGQ